jgi:hypothetical protein
MLILAFTGSINDAWFLPPVTISFRRPRDICRVGEAIYCLFSERGKGEYSAPRRRHARLPRTILLTKKSILMNCYSMPWSLVSVHDVSIDILQMVRPHVSSRSAPLKIQEYQPFFFSLKMTPPEPCKKRFLGPHWRSPRSRTTHLPKC